jgi:hypothetical protein
MDSIITAILVTVPFCFVATRFFIRKETDLFFDKRLEQFRTELKMLTKQAEFDYSRKTSAFNIFFEKKHECYFKFYDHVTNAIGLLYSLYGFRRETPIDMMRIQDIERTLKNSGCSDALVADYLERIERQGLDAVGPALVKLMRSIEFDKAEMACVEAKNNLIISRLYFEPSLYEICSTLCKDLLIQHIEYRTAFDAPGFGNSEKQKVLTDKINYGIEEIIRLMQAELGVGYFEPTTRVEQLLGRDFHGDTGPKGDSS